MTRESWTDAVIEAVRRHVARAGSPLFTRQALIEAELDNMIGATRSSGATPFQTLSRELQQLRRSGALDFIDDHGTYRWLGLP